jgi:hypothetical protein
MLDITRAAFVLDQWATMRFFPWGMVNLHRIKFILPGCLLSLITACHQAAPPPVAAMPSPAMQWAAQRDRFIEEYFKANPFEAVLAGRHEFDGRMPDLSAAGLAREVDRLHAARNAIAAVDPATQIGRASCRERV